jgi:aspartyl aminopeptidase
LQIVNIHNFQTAVFKNTIILFNQLLRYATNTVSAGYIREAARLAQVPIQDYMVKNDSPCGTTIGPILSSKLGITTADIGGPQLSMHSIRETGSTVSISQLCDLLTSFYRNYSKISAYFSDVL